MLVHIMKRIQSRVLYSQYILFFVTNSHHRVYTFDFLRIGGLVVKLAVAISKDNSASPGVCAASVSAVILHLTIIIVRFPAGCTKFFLAGFGVNCGWVYAISEVTVLPGLRLHPLQDQQNLRVFRIILSF